MLVARWFLAMGRYVLASTPGGREELRGLVDPELADLVDELQPHEVRSCGEIGREWRPRVARA